MNYEIHVASKEQAVLMECELQGQISDGYWENAKPLNHYKGVSGADVIIDTESYITFYPARKYNFAAPFLIECVGDRMLEYVRFIQAYPELPINVIRSIDSSSWFWNEDREWAAKQRAVFKEILGVTSYEEMQQKRAEVNSNATYQLKDLRKDLKALNEVFKVTKYK